MFTQLNTWLLIGRTLLRQPQYPTRSCGLLVVSRASLPLGREYLNASTSDILIILKDLTEKRKKMSKNTKRFLERKLRKTEELLADSDHENHKLRMESYQFFEALGDLKEEHEDLKRKYEKLVHIIKENNLSEAFLEEFEKLAIAD